MTSNHAPCQYLSHAVSTTDSPSSPSNHASPRRPCLLQLRACLPTLSFRGAVVLKLSLSHCARNGSNPNCRSSCTGVRRRAQHVRRHIAGPPRARPHPGSRLRPLLRCGRRRRRCACTAGVLVACGRRHIPHHDLAPDAASAACGICNTPKNSAWSLPAAKMAKSTSQHR